MGMKVRGHQSWGLHFLSQKVNLKTFKTSQINSTISVLEMRRDPQLKKRNRVTSRESQGLLVVLENQEVAARPQLCKSCKKKTLQKRRKTRSSRQSLSKWSLSRTRVKSISRSPEGSELPKSFLMSALDRQYKQIWGIIKMSSTIIKGVLSQMIVKWNWASRKRN